MKTLKNRWFLLCFQHLGVLGGLLRTLFLVFFIFDRISTVFSVSDRFFCFPNCIYVRFLVSDRFFGFFGRDLAPRAYSWARLSPLVGSWEVLGWSWGVLGDSLGDPVGDQARQTLRLCMFARFLSGGPQGFLVGPWDVLGGAWGLLGGTLGVLGRP